MSALEYLTTGGMAASGGDLSEQSRERCNLIVRTFATAVRTHAAQRGIPASALIVFRAQYLLMIEDAVNYSFVLASKPGGTTLLYRDLRAAGFMLLEGISEDVRINVGDVVHAFATPKNISEENLSELARIYVDEVAGAEKNRLSGRESDPADLILSIQAFRNDYPDGQKTAFIMMSFEGTAAHEATVTVVRETLKRHGIVGLRADSKDYAEDLFANVRTYMHCCDFGVAVFERLTSDVFNPNVSLEVGYMMGLRKPVCLLKDNTLRSLTSDLAGKLYKNFDTQKIAESIPGPLEKWLMDRALSF